jgi:hypothetical protein
MLRSMSSIAAEMRHRARHPAQAMDFPCAGLFFENGKSVQGALSVDNSGSPQPETKT